MNPNICNNCGGSFERRDGKWVCAWCGSYKPEAISNEEVTLLYTAFQKLRLAEFSEAEQSFDDIIRKYPENPNGYWGRLMARYGIKYEQDFDGRMIPTCYAASMESVVSAPDYRKALQYADGECKAYYKKQAEYIERVRKEWIEKARKEKPYDIFICYKESDLARGIDRTRDSVAAQDLYLHLTRKGYRVFFSHESLRDKVGEKYEPYIYGALSTAKIMIVYGSDPDYITSTWIKNEWTRYEKRIQSGEKKPNSLIVACDGFSPNQLPGALASMQCMDAKDKSFYSDLDESIEKIIYGETLSQKRKQKRKARAPYTITALVLLTALLGAPAWYFIRPVSTVTDPRYGASISAEYGSFSWNTSLLVEALTADGEWESAISGLPVDPDGSRLYGMSLWNGDREQAWEGDLTVSIPLPKGISEARAELYEASGNAFKKIHFEIQNGNLVFTTHHLGVYLITHRAHTPTADAAVAPTCTANGYTEGSHCADCNEILTARQVIPALGHTKGAEATCTESQSCTTCGEILIAAKGHQTGNLPCTQERVCTVCMETLAPATDHTPGAQATCTSPQICTGCGMQLQPASGHAHIAVVTEPTCTEDGYTKHTCHCGDTYTDGLVPATGHQSNGEISCAQDQLCTVCGVLLKEASSHTLGEWKIEKEPTKTENGAIVLRCTVCNRICDEKSISATGSQGLSYKKNFDGTTCTITGIGTCTDTDVIIPSELGGYTVTAIEQSAFQSTLFKKSKLTSVVIPDTVTRIKTNAFKDCDSLTEIVFGSGLERIDMCAFEGCSALTDIVIPGSLKKMGQYAFRKCDALTSVTFADGVTAIGKYAFFRCKSLTNVSMPDSLTKIGAYAFAFCDSLTEIVIPDSVTKIGNRAFTECSSLTSAVIGSGVKRISARMFLNCESLKKVTLSENLKHIGECAFFGCESLTEIHYRGTTEQWGGSKGFLGIGRRRTIFFGLIWNNETGSYTVYCSDGTVSKAGLITLY